MRSPPRPPSGPLPSRSLTATSHVASVEPRLGVPTFFWAAPPPDGARSLRDQGLSVEQAARRHLFSHAALYRAQPAELAESPLVRLHDTGPGVIIASFEKRLGGVSVFRDRLHVAMNQRLELVALSGYLSPAALKDSSFRLAAPTAFAAAWLDLVGTPVESFSFRGGTLDDAGFQRFTSTSEQPFSGRAKKVLYPCRSGWCPPGTVGASREVKPGVVVELSASASTDPDGDPLRFAWTQTGLRRGDPGGRGHGGGHLHHALPPATGCGCTSSSGLFAGMLPLLRLALRRRRSR